MCSASYTNQRVFTKTILYTSNHNLLYVHTIYKCMRCLHGPTNYMHGLSVDDALGCGGMFDHRPVFVDTWYC